MAFNASVIFGIFLRNHSKIHDPYMNVRLWSLLLFSDIASAVNCASFQLAASVAFFFFSSLYMYFKNIKLIMPQAIMIMVTIKEISSANGLG